MERGATGAVVVRAVIEKISTYGLFSRCEWWNSSLNLITFKLFLREAAFVLTEDGERAPPGHGGIWNISTSVYNHTMNYLSENPSITEAVNVDLASYTYMNLDKPIYSGLAAVLFLHEHILYMNSCFDTRDAPLKKKAYGFWMDWMEVIGTTLSAEYWRNRALHLETYESKFCE